VPFSYPPTPWAAEITLIKKEIFVEIFSWRGGDGVVELVQNARATGFFEN
jgi:hypothetical protein